MNFDVCLSENRERETCINIHLVKPKVDGKPTDVSCLLNETAKLTMKFTAVPKPTITWHRPDGSEVIPDDRIQIVTDDNGQSTLTIANVTQQDSQAYTARATNKVGSVDGKVTLTVKGKSTGHREKAGSTSSNFCSRSETFSEK